MTLRDETDKAFTSGSCLRSLAHDIATTTWANAGTSGFLTATPPMFNLLANGETGGTWQRPYGTTIAELLAWKYAANGFIGPTGRGLAFLFDPFVDATLLIEARKGSSSFRSTTVLVLTDYSPLSTIIGQCAVLGGADWAEYEVNSFFNAEQLGTTGCNIFKAVTGLDSIDEIRDRGPEFIQESFARHRLLIWNYIPFSRGGLHVSGMKGLPDPKHSGWIPVCENFLCRFLACVNASSVIFAVNGNVAKARSNSFSSNGACGVPMASFNHPQSWSSVEIKAVEGHLQERAHQSTGS